MVYRSQTAAMEVSFRSFTHGSAMPSFRLTPLSAFFGLCLALLFMTSPARSGEIDDLIGSYRVDKADNDWHVGTITKKPASPGMLEWRNAAGVVWTLIPDLGRNALKTDSTNPYFEDGDREFALVREAGRIVGFTFRSETYRRSDDYVGEYQLETVDNDWQVGKITRNATTGKLEWRNNAGVTWTLSPDPNGNVLRTDATNPYEKDGIRDFRLLKAGGKITGFVFKGETYYKKGEKKVVRTLLQKQDGLHGYIAASIAAPPDGYGYGVSFYANSWQMLEQPLDLFQIGLPSTWLIPDNRDFKQPLCPPGTVARDTMPERAPYWVDVFQTIEGGLGFWANEQFATAIPKYRINGTPNGYNHEISSPGWAFGGGGDRAALADAKLGIAQLSNRLLVPPDGITFHRTKFTGLLGNAWMALPLTESQSGTAAPTGGNSWTLFLNAANFSGPVAFWIPETWSRLSQGYPTIAGRGLDARAAVMSGGAMEFNTVPYFEAQDRNGTTYSRIPKLMFPADDRGEAVLMQDIVMYSSAALFDALKASAAGGDIGDGVFKTDEEAAFKPKITAQPLRFQQGDDAAPLKNLEAVVQTAVFNGAGSSAFGLRWSDARSKGAFPEYFRREGKELRPVVAAEVSDETSLKEQIFRPAQAGETYVSPTTSNSSWRRPGAARGPFQVTLSDGSYVTYSWYRFVDQPSIQALNWSAAKKQRVQAIVERIHRQWTIGRSYMPAPSRGTLATLDDNLVVTPPAGLEAGYVPIVTNQASSRNPDPNFRRN